MTDHPETIPERCLLSHPVFTMLGSVSFRRARTDGTPVMVVTLGEREAVMPLRALQREFGIDDNSPDGRMLGLIAESLGYVCGLSLGDKLPSEVTSGRASWEPTKDHRRLATNIIKLQLLAVIDPHATDPAKGDPLLRLDSDPALRQKVQAAFERAAVELGLPDASAVITMVEELSAELAYIEALRDRLLRPVQSMTGRLDRLALTYRGDSQRQESVNRVIRLAATARQGFEKRFDDVAAQTGEVMSALRNMESQQAFIRSNRDQLYREQRAWQPILDGWAATDPAEEVPWDLIMRTYQFLAPRYMPVTEWSATNTVRQPRDGKAKQAPVMSW